MVNRPVLEVRWDWLAEVDRKLQARHHEAARAVEEAKDLLAVGIWFHVWMHPLPADWDSQRGWSRPFRVMAHTPLVCKFRTREEAAVVRQGVRSRTMPWTTMATLLAKGTIRFLHPDGTVMSEENT